MNVEAATAIKMVNNQIYPATIQYLDKIAKTYISLKNIGAISEFLSTDIEELTRLLNHMKEVVTSLERAV